MPQRQFKKIKKEEAILSHISRICSAVGPNNEPWLLSQLHARVLVARLLLHKRRRSTGITGRCRHRRQSMTCGSRVTSLHVENRRGRLPVTVHHLILNDANGTCPAIRVIAIGHGSSKSL